MNALELYDALYDAVEEARRKPRRLGRPRIAIDLNTPSVCIGERQWRSRREAPGGGWSYTLRQARQMRDALGACFGELADMEIAIT